MLAKISLKTGSKNGGHIPIYAKGGVYLSKLIFTHLLFCQIAIGLIVFNFRFPLHFYSLIFILPSLYVSIKLLRRNALLSSLVLLILIIVFTYGIMLANADPTKLKFHRWFPKQYFVKELICPANGVLLFSMSLLTYCLWRYMPKKWDWVAHSSKEYSVAKLLAWPFIIFGFLVMASDTHGPTILEASYHSYEYISLGGGQRSNAIQLTAFALMVLGLIASIRAFGYNSKRFILHTFLVTGSIIYFHLLRGQRRISGGIFLVLISLYLMLSKSKKKFMISLIVSILVIIVLQAWPYVRFFAVDLGIRESLLKYLSQTFGLSNLSQFSLTNITRLPNAYWNLLFTIDLYDQGVYRYGLTFINLIPQVIPKFIADLIGLERPLADPWILAKYIEHGGAFFTIAQAYWNFGILCVAMYVYIIAKILVFSENYFRKNVPLLSFGYFFMILTVPYTILTGIQELARAIEVGLGFTIISKILYKWYRH